MELIDTAAKASFTTSIPSVLILREFRAAFGANREFNNLHQRPFQAGFDFLRPFGLGHFAREQFTLQVHGYFLLGERQMEIYPVGN